MKAFEFPEINVITFAVEDIVTASGNQSEWSSFEIPKVG